MFFTYHSGLETLLDSVQRPTVALLPTRWRNDPKKARSPQSKTLLSRRSAPGSRSAAHGGVGGDSPASDSSAGPVSSMAAVVDDRKSTALLSTPQVHSASCILRREQGIS